MRTRYSGHEHAHQSDAQLVRPRRPRDDVGKPAEDLDSVVGVAEADLLQVLRAERLLLDGLRGVVGHVDLLVGQRERRRTDHKMLAGADRESRRLLAAEVDRVARAGQLGDFQVPAAPDQLGVLSRDVLVPRDGPDAGRAAQHDALAVGQRPPPTLLCFFALGNQVGHRGEGSGIRNWVRDGRFGAGPCRPGGVACGLPTVRYGPSRGAPDTTPFQARHRIATSNRIAMLRARITGTHGLGPCVRRVLRELTVTRSPWLPLASYTSFGEFRTRSTSVWAPSEKLTWRTAPLGDALPTRTE